ncbi:MAG TPA: 3,4-dihydroxy-2-butanone-4-phosphate synthase [Candidatus Saccharimonadales bacterium]|nr:3,4-dihydroxy-2-butanone-4-phosphate synthase [Candidatus Saccharimonadales bacterium]
MAERFNLICTVPEALDELRCGRVLIVIDDETHSSEAHVVAALDNASVKTLRFMESVAGGRMYLAQTQKAQPRKIQLPKELKKEFELSASFSDEQRGKPTARGRLADDMKHRIVPLRTRKHGVLARPGYAEAFVDLMRLAGLSPSGFICNVLHDNGTPLRSMTAIREFARLHGLRLFGISRLIEYRIANETLVRPTAAIHLETRYGAFNFTNYVSEVFNSCAVLSNGEKDFEAKAPLVRIEPVSLIGNTAAPLLTYLRGSFDESLNLISREGSGIVICVPTPQSANSEEHPLADSLANHDDPFLTLWASPHRRLLLAGFSAQILHCLHAERIRVISDHPQRLEDLKEFGIDIVEGVPLGGRSGRYKRNVVQQCEGVVRK